MLSFVVVPGYRLVWYNKASYVFFMDKVVVPGYRLVWYNPLTPIEDTEDVVVPGYRLVWYNYPDLGALSPPLLFPVIAWYGIIEALVKFVDSWLLFPVIAWYGIIHGSENILLP